MKCHEHPVEILDFLNIGETDLLWSQKLPFWPDSQVIAESKLLRRVNSQHGWNNLK